MEFFQDVFLKSEKIEMNLVKRDAFLSFFLGDEGCDKDLNSYVMLLCHVNEGLGSSSEIMVTKIQKLPVIILIRR